VLKLLVTMVGYVSGLRDGKPWPLPGHAVDLPDDEAIQLIGNQMAVPATDPDTGVETAVRAQTPIEKREALVGKRTAKASTAH
jgi:hypothetical protein